MRSGRRKKKRRAARACEREREKRRERERVFLLSLSLSLSLFLPALSSILGRGGKEEIERRTRVREERESFSALSPSFSLRTRPLFLSLSLSFSLHLRPSLPSSKPSVPPGGQGSSAPFLCCFCFCSPFFLFSSSSREREMKERKQLGQQQERGRFFPRPFFFLLFFPFLLDQRRKEKTYFPIYPKKERAKYIFTFLPTCMFVERIERNGRAY